MPKDSKAEKAKKPGPSTSTEHALSARHKPRGANVRLSHHKARGRWFQARSAWPGGEAPVHMLIRERERAAKSLPATAVDSSWECVGPTNIGGRITSLVCHPDHPELIWAGSAGGGVWLWSDAGQTWRSCLREQDILNKGLVGIYQRKPDTNYCGARED